MKSQGFLLERKCIAVTKFIKLICSSHSVWKLSVLVDLYFSDNFVKLKQLLQLILGNYSIVECMLRNPTLYTLYNNIKEIQLKVTIRQKRYLVSTLHTNPFYQPKSKQRAVKF